jgi:lipoprotein-releasing system permease protein
MFSSFEWMMALRYLRARRQEGFVSVIAWFSLLGIMLGVATLIIVMSVMNGFRQELLTRILGVNGHLSIYGESQQLNNFDDLGLRIKNINGVVKVMPTAEGHVMASANGQAKGAVVRGLRQSDIMSRPILSGNIQQGSLKNFIGNNAVVLGYRMARSLSLKIGDKLTLISPKGNVTAFGTVPRMKAYRVAAIFDVGMHEYDSGFIFMPLAAAQVYFKFPASVSYLDVTIKNPNSAAEMVRIIRNKLGSKIRVYDWQRTNSSFFNAIQVERNVMFLILTLIIVVAAFNIISGMIMLVKDKGRDIGILRTMGATRAMVMRIFLISGASIGIVGTLAGFCLGIAFASNIETIRQILQGLTGTDLFAAEIYFLSKLPAVVDPGEVLTVVLMGLGLSFLATIYPSWRAARLDPLEALRYE